MNSLYAEHRFSSATDQPKINPKPVEIKVPNSIRFAFICAKYAALGLGFTPAVIEFILEGSPNQKEVQLKKYLQASTELAKVGIKLELESDGLSPSSSVRVKLDCIFPAAKDETINFNWAQNALDLGFRLTLQIKPVRTESGTVIYDVVRQQRNNFPVPPPEAVLRCTKAYQLQLGRADRLEPSKVGDTTEALLQLMLKIAKSAASEKESPVAIALKPLLTE